MLNKICHKIPGLRSLLRQLETARYQRTWRRRNAHNQTMAATRFPLQAVRVGRHTYGELHVDCFTDAPDQLIIGHYVSIARGVRFLLSCNHQTGTLTTFPLRSHLEGGHHPADAVSRGQTRVDDGAWLGAGAIILDGVHIGREAIVAAGAV